jgi:hypothetical protein
MSAVLLAVFNDFETAERVLIELVRDGFPTDRVELTAGCQPGRAGCGPGTTQHEKFVQYYRTLFCREDEIGCAEIFAERLAHGAATITVHPRGPVETARASEILDQAAPVEIKQHDLGNQRMEHAAARRDGPWIRNFWVQSTKKLDCDCIYCRLFEKGIA